MLMPDMSMVAGPTQAAAVGQIEFLATGFSESETQTFVVPAEVFSLSACIVADRASVCRILRGAAVLLSTSEVVIGNALQGGGGGGSAGANNPGQPAFDGRGGGGGAGGYDGFGGFGGNVNFAQNAPQGGGNGNGGAGGGGAGSYEFINIDTGQSGGIRSGSNGGGVGMRGKGANGTGGQFVYPSTTPGAPGSPASSAPLVGAGTTGSPGGNLRWRNEIAVTPGEALTISLGSSARDAASGVGAGARLLWGAGRSYPNNAA